MSFGFGRVFDFNWIVGDDFGFETKFFGGFKEDKVIGVFYYFHMELVYNTPI